MTNSLVTGGAGFIGSHLVDRLLDEGKDVVCVDNLITGSRDNVKHLKSTKSFRLIEADVSEAVDTYLPQDVKIDEIYHLASPASPIGYQEKPVETYKVNSFGTHHLLEYAKKVGARFLFASTSEVYGDPKVHPQKESYWGNVNPIGVRACYDESKRFGEMAIKVFEHEFKLDTRIVRIFNTYGPRFPDDERVIPNFLKQALSDRPITVHGDGSQTRSFCYVSDLVEYIIRAMKTPSAAGLPINIGNDQEFSVKELAGKIKRLTKSSSQIVFENKREDDPTRRKPDLTLAKSMLGYEPQVGIDEGLKKTIEYFRGKQLG